MPLSYALVTRDVVSGYVLTNMYELLLKQVRCTCRELAKQVGARTGPVPKFFFLLIVCACEIGASSSFNISH